MKLKIINKKYQQIEIACVFAWVATCVVILMILIIMSWVSGDTYSISTNALGEKIIELPMFTILNLMTLNYLRKNLMKKLNVWAFYITI